MQQRRPFPRSNRGGRRDPSALRSEHAWRDELDADLAAMAKVWRMLRYGAVRMLGEIGRQY